MRRWALVARRLARRFPPVPAAVAAIFVLLLSGGALAYAALHPVPTPAPSGQTDMSAVSERFELKSIGALGLVDTDGDGVPDAAENALYGTNPAEWGTAGRRIPDGWLIRYGLDPVDPTIAQRPAAAPPPDSLPPSYDHQWPERFVATLHDVYAYARPANWNETEDGLYESGLDPTRWDNRGDEIPDGWLLHHGLDPTDSAVATQRPSGSGGLTVAEAFEHNADPRVLDTSGNGIPDRAKVDGPRNPLYPSQGPPRFPALEPGVFDTSGTGVCDGYLVAHGIDPHDVASVLGDLAHSGATTQQKYNWSRENEGDQACATGAGLDPRARSTAGLPIPDGWMLRYGLDPLDAEAPSDVVQCSGDDPQPEPLPSRDAPSGAPALDEICLTVLEKYTYGRPSEWDEASQGPWWDGLDPSVRDTDGDGLGDAWEMRGYYVTAATDPMNSETEAYWTNSDPRRVDTSADGLTDLQKVDPTKRSGLVGPAVALDARRRDTAFSGMTDLEKLTLNAALASAYPGLEDFLDPTRADSAGDLLTDGVRHRLLASRAEAYAHDLDYEFPGPPGAGRSVADSLIDGATGLPTPLSASDVGGRVGPLGDLTGRGAPNLLVADIDADELLNGWEVDPALYSRSAHGVGPLAAGRSVTDPLNADTDGDKLPDGWEVKYGKPLFSVGRYNLDPALWDSTGDGTSDADEDYDADGIVYTWFDEDDQGHAEDWPFDNLKEYQYGGDPNDATSSNDGLLDGWKVFWGFVYPTLDVGTHPPRGATYPGAPGALDLSRVAQAPSIGVDQASATVSTHAYQRFVLDANALRPGETPGQNYADVYNPAGGSRTVHELQGTVPWTFVDVQNAGTNPYAADTDGDGMEDWWEVHAATVPAGTRDGDGNDVAECLAQTTQAPDPVRYDGGSDPDADGLPNRVEFELGAHPLCADSDLGGIKDGDEVAVHLDPAHPPDDKGLLDGSVDTDGDGVRDFLELTGSPATDPNNPDTDGDGLLDGATMPSAGQSGWPRSNATAERFLDLGIAYFRDDQGLLHFRGEQNAGTDPTDPDDCNCGIPAGWLLSHTGGLNPTANAVTAYNLARPSWWDEPVHGPWWGGADPSENLPSLSNHDDLDGDGLRDRDGADAYEDAMPGNRNNTLRAINQTRHGAVVPLDSSGADASLPPLVRRLLAQAYLEPLVEGSKYVHADHNLPPAPTRPQPCLTVDSAGSTKDYTKGEQGTVRGSLRSACSGGQPVAGAVIEVRGGSPDDHPLGYAVTQADGSYTATVVVAGERSYMAPSGTGVLRGVTGSGERTWSVPPADLPLGNQVFLVRSYSTAQRASESQPLNGVVVRAASNLSIDAPENVQAGQAFLVSLRLTDSGLAPLNDPLFVTWQGQTTPLTPRSDGSAEFVAQSPADASGQLTLRVRSQPPQASSAWRTAADENITVNVLRPITLRLDPFPSSIDAGTILSPRGSVSLPGGPLGSANVTVALLLSGQPIAIDSATTAPDGTFRVQLPIPPTTASCDCLVRATMDATPTTTAAQTTQLLHVRGLPRFDQVDLTNITKGGPVQVAGRLLDPTGHPIASAPIHLTTGANHLNLTSDAAGRFEATPPWSLRVGPVLQTLRFAGDATVAPVTRVDERFVSAGTALSVDGGVAPRGGEATILARLLDSDGNPVANAPVLFTWAGEPSSTPLTASDGTAVLVRRIAADAPLGPASLRVRYAGTGDGGLGPAEAATTWRVVSAARLIMEDSAQELGTTPPQGRLVDLATGAGIPEANVTLDYDDGRPLETIATDETGRFSLLPSMPAQALPFAVRVRAITEATSAYPSVESSALVAFRSPTQVLPGPSPVIIAGRDVFFVSNVLDPNGRPVPAGWLNASLGGMPVGEATVLNGTARISLHAPATATAGLAQINLTYSGTTFYQPSSAVVAATILSAPNLTIEVEPAEPGGLARVRITATVDGAPLAGTLVSVLVEGAPNGISGRTDENGTAVFWIPQDGQGHALVAKVAPGGALGPSSAAAMIVPLSATTTLQRVTHSWTPWVLVGVAALVLAAAAYALRVRRAGLTDSFRLARRAIRARGPISYQILLAYRIIEDDAIAHGVILSPAPTPRTLQEALAAKIPREAHRFLDGLMTVFEMARYGNVALTENHRAAARESLAQIVDALARADAFLGGAAAQGPAPVVASLLSEEEAARSARPSRGRRAPNRDTW